MLTAEYVVLDMRTQECLYQGSSFAQVKGFTDAQDRACIIAQTMRAMPERTEWLYRIVLMDASSGQIIADGPIIHLMESLDLLDRVRVVLLPANELGGQPHGSR